MATTNREALETLRTSVIKAYRSNTISVKARDEAIALVDGMMGYPNSLLEGDGPRVDMPYTFAENGEQMETFPGAHPYKAHADDAGTDLPCYQTVTIRPHSFADVSTNIRVQIPVGYWGMICSRSSAWFKKRLFVYQGKIDNGFRGELMYGVFNPTNSPITIHRGERLAQFILVPQIDPKWTYTSQGLEPSERGEAGFGSSGGMHGVSEWQAANGDVMSIEKMPEEALQHPYGPDRDMDGFPLKTNRPGGEWAPEMGHIWHGPVDQTPQQRMDAVAQAVERMTERDQLDSLAEAAARMRSYGQEQDATGHMEADGIYDPEMRAKANRLRAWAIDTLMHDLDRTLPKIEEYGNDTAHDDLALFGDLVDMLTGGKITDPVLRKEAGCALYIGGKVARMLAAYAAGRAPSEDTWFDAFIYSMMGRKLRETGTWP